MHKIWDPISINVFALCKALINLLLLFLSVPGLNSLISGDKNPIFVSGIWRPGKDSSFVAGKMGLEEPKARVDISPQDSAGQPQREVSTTLLEWTDTCSLGLENPRQDLLNFLNIVLGLSLTLSFLGSMVFCFLVFGGHCSHIQELVCPGRQHLVYFFLLPSFSSPSFFPILLRHLFLTRTRELLFRHSSTWCRNCCFCNHVY